MEGVRKRGTADGANGAAAGGKRARGESSGTRRPRSGRCKPSSSRDVFPRLSVEHFGAFASRGGLGWVPGFELFAMLGFGDFQGMLRGAVIWWLGSGVVDWWNENRSVPYVSSTRRVFFLYAVNFAVFR
jgi:hypothetical protein